MTDNSPRDFDYTISLHWVGSGLFGDPPELHATIFDKLGNRVDSEIGRRVADAIKRSYPTPCYVYIAQVLSPNEQTRNHYKIGITNNINKRERELDCIIDYAMRCYDRSNALFHERILHQKLRYSGKHIRGEWFCLSPEELDELIKEMKMERVRS